MSFIVNFLLRHRKKFFYAGVISLGVTLLNKYAANRIIDWHHNHSNNVIAKRKRKQHYEKLRQTAISTVLGLSGSITKIISESLETDTILQAIKSPTGNKSELWEQLKTLSFSRCVSSVYVASLLSVFVHVKIMVLGGYSFSGATNSDDSNNRLTDDLQERYLLGIYSLIEDGLPLLTKAIHDNVKNSISDLKLHRKLTLNQLETILSNLCLVGPEGREDADYLRKSRYLCFQNLIDEASKWPDSPKKHTLLKMLEETKEIIYTEDFKSLLFILVQTCLNHIMDHLADQFRISNGANSIVDANCSQIGENDLNGAVPVAKLLPGLSRIVSIKLSPATGQLFSNILINNHLEAFSFNVYESFSRMS